MSRPRARTRRQRRTARALRRDSAASAQFLYRRTGMLFGESKRYYIERRIADRMAATGTRTFPAYFAHRRVRRGEVEQLINSFTVNETYFYREEHQLRCLSRSLLPEIVQGRRPGDLVRIWSVPCSTGRSPIPSPSGCSRTGPWSMPTTSRSSARISTRGCCWRLRLGHYGERALSRLPPDVVERYFEPSETVSAG